MFVPIGGYEIPKGTILLTNIHGVHRDPANFSDPDTFNPDRWIDANGKFQYHPYKFIPFSMGPRVCVGESLAKADLLMFAASLFHKFEFRPISDDFRLQLKPAPFTIEAAPFNAKVLLRH